MLPAANSNYRSALALRYWALALRSGEANICTVRSNRNTRAIIFTLELQWSYFIDHRGFQSRYQLQDSEKNTVHL